MSCPGVQRTVLCDRCLASIEFNHHASAPYTRRSDYIPSADEAARARSFVEEGKETIKLYDRELERIRAVLEKLEADKASLQQQIEEQSAMISPMRRIPVELWQRIFSMACLPYGEKGIFGQALRIQRFEVEAPAAQISRTSSHWRNIAINYPYLWTSILIDLGLFRSPGIDLRALTSIYLKNAGTSPLTIAVHDTKKERWTENNVPMTSSGIGMAIFRMLLPHAERIDELMFVNISGFALMEQICGAPDLRFPILRTFRCDVDMENVPFGSTIWFWEALSDTPRLKHVEGPLLPAEVDMLPYDQLTYLDCQKADDYDELFEAISASPNLENLAFRWDPAVPDDVTLMPCTLSSLRVLTIHTAWSLDISTRVLNCFNAPNLTSLSLSSMSGSVPYVVPEIVLNALSRFSDTLQELRLDLMRVRLSNTSISKVLAVLPNLTYFCVSLRGGSEQEKGSPCISHLLTSLTVPSEPAPGHHVLGPRLTRLFLHEDHTSVDFGVIDRLLTMVESRSTSGLARSGMEPRVARLRYVEFTYWTSKAGPGGNRILDDFITSQDRKRIRLLEADGTSCRLEEEWGVIKSLI